MLHKRRLVTCNSLGSKTAAPVLATSVATSALAGAITSAVPSTSIALAASVSSVTPSISAIPPICAVPSTSPSASVSVIPSISPPVSISATPTVSPSPVNVRVAGTTPDIILFTRGEVSAEVMNMVVDAVHKHIVGVRFGVTAIDCIVETPYDAAIHSVGIDPIVKLVTQT